jgi:hypothetical protein
MSMRHRAGGPEPFQIGQAALATPYACPAPTGIPDAVEEAGGRVADGNLEVGDGGGGEVVGPVEGHERSLKV